MVRRNLVDSRTEAQQAINTGLVRVGANPAPKASTLVAPDEPIHIAAPPERFVSRAGAKLAAALEVFPIEVKGKRAIDLGASTGGFTDCLLQAGAAAVVALDVGYGQMHWRIRQDQRVEVVERVNVRNVDPGQYGAPFALVVGDLSFISLRTIVEPVAAFGNDDADWVLLIKPQFEVGRGAVGKGGIVRSRVTRHDAVRHVVDVFAQHGLGVRGLIASPITGATGNIEYVAWFTRTPASIDVDDVLATIEEPES